MPQGPTLRMSDFCFSAPFIVTFVPELPFFLRFPLATLATQSSLIIPNQQMNLGGKMDKPAGSGKTEAKIPLKALKGKQIRLVGGGVGLAVSRLGINRIRHVNKRKRQSWKK